MLSNGKNLIEVPPQTLKISKIKIPLGGGIYLRIFPLWLNKLAINRTNNSGFPGRVMLHPHELDPNPPILNVSFDAWLIKYFRINKVDSILRRILSEYSSYTYKNFLSMFDVDNLPKIYLK